MRNFCPLRTKPAIRCKSRRHQTPPGPLSVHDLAVDFGLTVEVPRIWSDSSTGITAAKRIGPVTKLRHLDVSEFYVQRAVQAVKVLLRKVKGTENPANYLTKHPETGNEVAGTTALERHV